MKLCECNCGQEVKYEGNRFVQGHNHSRLGKHCSEETKKKMSENSGVKGEHHSEESKKKMSDTNKGRIFSEEIKNKIRENHVGFIGKHHSEETKKRMSDANKGRIFSEEHKKKMSENHKFAVNSSYSKWSICNKGHWVRSTWERKVADFLLDNEIEYEFEKQRFYFEEFSYLPDFYIPSIDLWIEVKGWMKEYDALQIKLFIEAGHDLLIIDKSNINNLVRILYFIFLEQIIVNV